MSITCTIGGTSVNVKAAQPFKVVDAIEIPGQLTLTVEDSAGTLNFTRGQPVTLTDSGLGTLFTGYVLSSQPTKAGPASTQIEHYVSCTDKTYLLTKRENTTNYQNWYAGDIAVDFVEGTLAAEGITVAAGSHRDTTTSDFNQGVLNGVTGYGTIDDGDLELTKAGSDLAIVPDLSAGTFANTTYSGGVIVPTTIPTIKMTSVLSTPLPSNGTDYIYVTIWTGSITLHTNDTLTCGIFLPSTNKQFSATVNMLLNDGTRVNSAYNVFDQNNVVSGLYASSDLVDISAYATDRWYTRVFTIPSTLNGKIVTSLQIGIGGRTTGTYIGYYKSIILSGNTIFSGTTNANSVLIAQGFNSAQTTIDIVQAYDPATSSWVSAPNSISAVSLVKSSSVAYSAINPSNLTLLTSYDGGGAWTTVSNNSVLPALPAGTNVSGLSVLFKTIYATSDPTLLPTLENITANLLSAPHATKSDLVQTYETQAQWNTGTFTSTSADANGNLTNGPLTRNWNDNLITNQTFFNNNSVTQSATGGTYQISMPNNASANFGISRLDFAGSVLNFTLDIDVKLTHTIGEAGVTYRQLNWVSGTNNTFGYYVGIVNRDDISQEYVQIGYGSNATNDSYTQIATSNQTIAANTTYHLKIVVNDTHHQVYFNNGATPVIDIYDSTYKQAGNIGLRGFCVASVGATVTSVFDNLSMTPAATGTWLSSAIPLSSLGTCGLSAISWLETNTSNPVVASSLVETSINGGSTYQTCTNNGAIPNLASGTSVSSVSVLIRVTLSAQANLLPSISGLVLRVLGAFPTSSGTRSTIPIAMDTAVRANQSGLGTASDGQAWSKVGTVTDAVSSNTLTLTNTTGDAFEILGSRTWTDEDATDRFQLSASTITDGLVLRYRDTNNYYRFSYSTTTLTLYKKSVSFGNTLATASVSLSTATWYRSRFRVSGSGPVSLQGRVWLDGTLEPTTWSITATD